MTKKKKKGKNLTNFKVEFLKSQGVEIDRSGNLFWFLILIKKYFSYIWSCRIFSPSINVATFWITKVMMHLEVRKFFSLQVRHRSMKHIS